MLNKNPPLTLTISWKMAILYVMIWAKPTAKYFVSICSSMEAKIPMAEISYNFYLVDKKQINLSIM